MVINNATVGCDLQGTPGFNFDDTVGASADGMNCFRRPERRVWSVHDQGATVLESTIGVLLPQNNFNLCVTNKLTKYLIYYDEMRWQWTLGGGGQKPKGGVRLVGSAGTLGIGMESRCWDRFLWRGQLPFVPLIITGMLCLASQIPPPFLRPFELPMWAGSGLFLLQTQYRDLKQCSSWAQPQAPPYQAISTLLFTSL